jgi:hypothetical protein
LQYKQVLCYFNAENSYFPPPGEYIAIGYMDVVRNYVRFIQNIKTRNVGSSITPVLDKVPKWQQDSLNFTYHLTFIKQSTWWQLNRHSQLNIKRAILDQLFFRNMQVCCLFI